MTLLQPRRGFRSSLDPILLARFLAPPYGRFLDIGCGTGALAFTLLADDPAARGLGVELQPRLARLELTLTLAEWLDCAARAVRPGGRLGVVYAAERLPELLGAMGERELMPARLRMVHPFVDRPAVRVLVEAVRGGRRALTVEPPLVLHVGDDGRFTDETRRILEMDG